MKVRPLIFGFFAVIALAIALFAAGCGGDDSSTKSTVVQCDPNTPSLIPAVSGKPQLIYFFRDT